MISQDTSFQLVYQELGLMAKRKQALEHMLTVGKITQATFDYLMKDLNESILKLSARKKALDEEKTPAANDSETHLKLPEPSVLKQEASTTVGKKDGVLLKTKVDPLPSVQSSPTPSPLVKVKTASKKAVSTALKKGRKRTRKTKKKAKKAKVTPIKLSSPSKSYCSNPWNGKCRNMNTEVIIYYENKMFPICQECWDEITAKNITW